MQKASTAPTTYPLIYARSLLSRAGHLLSLVEAFGPASATLAIRGEAKNGDARLMASSS